MAHRSRLATWTAAALTAAVIAFALGANAGRSPLSAQEGTATSEATPPPVFLPFLRRHAHTAADDNPNDNTAAHADAGAADGATAHSDQHGATADRRADEAAVLSLLHARSEQAVRRLVHLAEPELQHATGVCVLLRVRSAVGGGGV